MRVPSSLTLPEMQRAFRELQSLVLEGKEKSLSGGARNAHSSLAGIALPVGESDTTKLQAELEELRRILSDGILTEKEKAELRLRWAQAKTDFVYDVGSDRASGLAQLTGVNAAAYIATYDILDSISYLWEESGESRIDGAALDLYPAWKAFLNAKADFSSLAAAAVATLSNDLKARMDLAENDNALTETEKPLYRLTWAQIVEEYPTLSLGSMRINVHEERSALVLTYAALDAVKAAWMDAGTTDITALNPKPSALFGSYFTAKQALADRINGGIKQDLDLALDPAVVADGVTAQFLYTGPTVTCEDWRGVWTLSASPRTNLIKQNKAYDNSAWTKFANGLATLPVVTANAGLAPDGTMTADRITFNRGGSASTDICTVSQNVTGQTVGNPYAPSVWLKSNTGSNQQVMIYWSGLATGKGGGTITNVVTVTSEWQRFYCADLAAATTLAIQFGCRVSYGDMTLDILAWESQVETGTAPTPNIPTMASAVTVTDITVSNGLATLSPAPLQGAILRGLSSNAASVAASALAATIAAGSDGILSKGEKPGIIIDFNGATTDHTMLVAKAQGCGVPYVDFSSAYGTLRDYLESLSPAYTNTTTDTPINAASWAAVWGAWGSAYTSMLVRIASAAPSTVDGIATSNINISTNAAAPVVDGIARDAGKVVMLAGQTVKAQNGVYGVVYTPPTGTAYNVLPATATPSGGGATGQLANAYDVISGDTPNDATYATLLSGGEEGSYGEVVFSGFSGTNLTGDLTIKITPDCETGSGELSEVQPTIRVQTSTDSGATWSVGTFFHITTTMQTIAVPVSAATGSALRVKVRAQSAVAMDFDQNGNYVVVAILGCTAKVHSVYLAIPAQGVANWSLVKQASIPNASVWQTRAGTTRPPGSHYLATVATDNGVTLTTQEAPYEAPLGKPGSGPALLKRDSDGVTSWEARRFGFPDYASGASRSVGAVYQAATDGWLSLVLVGSYLNDVVVYVGSTNNPTNQVFRAGDDINSNTKYASGLIPIPAGTYYKVANGTYGFETTTLKWYPALT